MLSIRPLRAPFRNTIFGCWNVPGRRISYPSEVDDHFGWCDEEKSIGNAAESVRLAELIAADARETVPRDGHAYVVVSRSTRRRDQPVDPGCLHRPFRETDLLPGTDDLRLRLRASAIVGRSAGILPAGMKRERNAGTNRTQERNAGEQPGSYAILPVRVRGGMRGVRMGWLREADRLIPPILCLALLMTGLAIPTLASDLPPFPRAGGRPGGS